MALRRAKKAAPPGSPRRAPGQPARKWSFAPLTRERWADFVELFGEKGACAGCWCMYARLPLAEYRALGPEGRRAAIRRLAGSANTPGLLAYDGDRAVGWIAMGPRTHFRRLETSRVLAPVDDTPVWSTPCFFVARSHRGLGLQRALLEAACVWAASRGATQVEGYPVDTRGKRQPAAFVWPGLPGAYAGAGFREALRRSPTRPIMRRALRRGGGRG